MINTEVPESPGWWLKRLSDRLMDKQSRVDRLERYLLGNADLPNLGPKADVRRYQEFMRKAGINLSALIVDAVVNRLEPVGFRVGDSGDGAADADAWDIWRGNQLHTRAKEFHRGVLGLSEAYMIVGAVDPVLGVPLITPEDPRQVITEVDPARPWRTIAGLKLAKDTVHGLMVADLYLLLDGQSAVFKAHRPLQDEATPFDVFSLNEFEWVGAALLPTSRIPIVRFRNRPSLSGAVLGEFEDAIHHIDRVNHMIFQRMVIATVQAFKQRALKGVPQTDPNGDVIDYGSTLQSGPDALWILPSSAELWESSQVDMSGILNGERNDLESLATATHTPLYMLTGATNQSAEGASLQREALTFKAKDRQSELGGSHGLVMSLAFEVMGDSERARRSDIEMLWAPVSNLSLAERYDAAAKATAAGVPWATTMADVLQFPPAKIAEMAADPMVQRLIAGDVPAIA